jgi:hypothetical protein
MHIDPYPNGIANSLNLTPLFELYLCVSVSAKLNSKTKSTYIDLPVVYIVVINKTT